MKFNFLTSAEIIRVFKQALTTAIKILVLINSHLLLFFFLLTCFSVRAQEIGQDITLNNTEKILGAITRLDSTKKNVYLVFSAHELREGGSYVYRTLLQKQVPASFFFTGDFYREPKNGKLIKNLLQAGHYLGAHSDKHVLYAPWENRDSTLITKKQFLTDIRNNYREMARFGITKEEAHYFLPPYEWYNKGIAEWTEGFGLQLINYTAGTGTARDYTWPEMGKRYTTSQTIFDELLNFEEENGLNGAIILVHLGTDPRRKDKFYWKLERLVEVLKKRDYSFKKLP